MGCAYCVCDVWGYCNHISYCTMKHIKQLLYSFICLVVHYAAFVKDVTFFQFVSYFFMAATVFTLMSKKLRHEIKIKNWITCMIGLIYSSIVLYMTHETVYFYCYLVLILSIWLIRINNLTNSHEKLDNQ